MDERTRRVGLNEALFRQVNEEVETLERGRASLSDQTIHIVCECADLRCSDRLIVPLSEYEKVRADDSLFLVQPRHELPAYEDIVEETDRYTLVRKRKGEAQKLAEATDPRG